MRYVYLPSEPEQAIYVQSLRGVHCPISGALELSCCLSDGFLLVSILVSFVYLRQDLLFHACQFHSFQGMHHKELWSKEDNVLIVGGSISVISSPRQCVQFAYSMSKAVVTNFIQPYLHQFFDDSHSLNGYGKPLKRPFD